MMDYSVNSRTVFGNDDDSSTDDEERLFDDRTNPDNPLFEPTVLYKTDAIRDRYKFGYITFCLLGILTLLPWNFFATATDYWMYKFRDVHSNTSHTNKTELQAEFTSYLSIASTGPSLFFLILNIMYAHRISFQIRIIGSLIIMLMLFILTVVLVYVNTDKWQNIFFVITLLSATIMNIFSGILQASVWGVASKFSSKYISAATSGQALGGIFAALVCIVSLALSTSSTTSAMLYFSIAIITVLAGLVFYKILSISKFFKYHLLQKTPAKELNYDPAEINETSSAFEAMHVSVTAVLNKMWSYGFSVALCFAVTLSVYPSVTVLISSENVKGDWAAKYFVPVVAFLLFSIWDYIGRLLAGYLKWPFQKERLIIGFSFLRILFVPLILLCNAHPREYLPVLIHNDSYYITLTCLFGFTNGYLTNITMVNYRSCSQLLYTFIKAKLAAFAVQVILAFALTFVLRTFVNAVDDIEKEVASSLMAVFLALGCAAGSALSFVMLNIL